MALRAWRDMRENLKEYILLLKLVKINNYHIKPIYITSCITH